MYMFQIKKLEVASHKSVNPAHEVDFTLIFIQSLSTQFDWDQILNK